MELLLNLAWLLLALPAYWLWRGATTTAGRRRFTSLQCLLALGAMLVVLFPVVSATDDLRAMRAEMEESPASKRSVRLISADKASPWKLHSPPAVIEISKSFLLSEEGRQQLPALCLSVPTAPAIELAGRAPPDSFPG